VAWVPWWALASAVFQEELGCYRMDMEAVIDAICLVPCVTVIGGPKSEAAGAGGVGAATFMIGTEGGRIFRCYYDVNDMAGKCTPATTGWAVRQLNARAACSACMTWHHCTATQTHRKLGASVIAVQLLSIQAPPYNITYGWSLLFVYSSSPLQPRTSRRRWQARRAAAPAATSRSCGAPSRTRPTRRTRAPCTACPARPST
jgi:hypothetical protein